MRRVADVLELRREYDDFLVDLWGVVHDGERLFAGARATLEALAESGARVLFLTNSSRLGPRVAESLVAMGLRREMFVDVVSSGDVTRAALAARDPRPFGASPDAARVLHVGRASFVPWLFELGLAFVREPQRANLVVATGTVAGEAELDGLRRTLAPLAERGTPLVCTNPDRLIPSSAGLTLGPGAVAHAYASLGGPTFLYGKPHPPIYRAALARLGRPAAGVVAVGDTIETDIAGARRASLASVLVTTGVHAAELGEAPGDAALAAAFAAHGAAPDAVVAYFGRRA
ncbi:MAG TPA: TIGR01459 family HAD-type hydrolase [Polyangiaceae bacterium]|nr:TIGR01459 family HAD-type hydrolase [Polyangiaceae bacterium]